jgi:hypothetical protein
VRVKESGLLEPSSFYERSARYLIGDYAFDAGIVSVSFESEGQGFSVSRHSILKKYIKRCIEILPLRDAAVSTSELLCLSRDRSKRKGVESRKE